MRSKFSIILVCCVLALAVLMSSTLGAETTTLLQKLFVLPTEKNILKFNTKEALRLLLQQEQAYPETYIYTGGLAAANADISTGRVWAVVLNDGLDPGDAAQVGFKTNGLQNTGSTSLHGVTVTVTANILKIQQPSNDVYLHVAIYKDDSFIVGGEKEQWIKELGNYGLTSSSFTMEPSHNYYAVGFIFCRSSVENQATILVAEITDITWNI